jgi:hypothetical protein
MMLSENRFLLLDIVRPRRSSSANHFPRAATDS